MSVIFLKVAGGGQIFLSPIFLKIWGLVYLRDKLRKYSGLFRNSTSGGCLGPPIQNLDKIYFKNFQNYFFSQKK